MLIMRQDRSVALKDSAEKVRRFRQYLCSRSGEGVIFFAVVVCRRDGGAKKQRI
jgi:hypothetical protein